MRALVVALALLAPPPVTHDTLPVLVPPPGPAAGGIDVVWRWGGGFGSTPPVRLGVFRRPRTLADIAPAQLELYARLTGGHLDRSRLLVASGATRIYAFPAEGGKVCFMKLPLGGGTCVDSLVDGAYPQVDARRDAWGVVDDGAGSVDVDVGGRLLRPRIARNAFFVALPARTVAPTRIVVHERDGATHVYDVDRCTVGDITPFATPLGPPC